MILSRKIGEAPDSQRLSPILTCFSKRGVSSTSPASRRLAKSVSVQNGRPSPMTSQAPLLRASSMPARVRKPPVTISGIFATLRIFSA